MVVVPSMFPTSNNSSFDNVPLTPPVVVKRRFFKMGLKFNRVEYSLKSKLKTNLVSI